MNQIAQPVRLLDWDGLRHKGVLASKATLYRWIKDGKFPRPVYLGKSPAWSETEVDNHIRRLIAERDNARAA